jgi:hypothetical protein
MKFTNEMMQSKTVLLMAVVSSLAISLKAQAAPDVTELKTNETRLKSDIAKLNGNLSCKQDSDCAFLEVGAKACGGPRSYLIYSKANDKADILKRKANELTDNDKSLNKAQRTMSTCMALLPPEVRCVNLKCASTKH